MAYTLASALPRAVSFALLPLFTHILSPADYGQLSVALSVTAVSSIVFAFGFEIAVFRGLFQLADNPRASQQFLRSSWTFLMVAPLVLAVVLSALAWPLLLSSHILTSTRFGLSLIGAALSVAATTVPLDALRAQARVRDFVLLSSVIGVGATLLTVVLVVWARAGVDGWLVALIAANAIGLLVAMRMVPYQRPQPFDAAVIRRTLRFSLPVVPHFASLWALQLADRVLVASLLTLSAAGVYSLASNLAVPMYLVIIGFGQAFMPYYASAGKSSSSAKALPRMVGLQFSLVVGLCVAVALLAPPAVQLMDARYSAAAPLIPWLVLGYAFLGFYQIPMNGLTLTHGRTRGLVVVSGTGAASNIILIVTLAPTYGLEAVAIASAAGYGMLVATVMLFAHYRHASITYPWRQLGWSACIGVVGYTSAALLTAEDPVLASVSIRVGVVAVAAVAIAANCLGWNGLVQIVRARLPRRS